MITFSMNPSASSVDVPFPINTPQSLVDILSEPGWCQLNAHEAGWWEFWNVVGPLSITLAWYGTKWVADYASALDCCDSDEGYYAVACTGKSVIEAAELVKRIEAAIGN